MKFTLSWLKDHLETQASLDEILETLTAIGLEVEGCENPAEEFAPFKVAYVEQAERHPDADRLKVCKVRTADGVVQVVCGAPNARTGMKGVFAPEGSYIPGTDITLKKGNIRGQESCGMLVSEREMNLSDDHDGIIEVGDDVEIGTPFATLYGLDDPVIEIGLTPNRGDCAGIRGIARDLAAAGLGTLKPLPEDDIKESGSSPVQVSLSFDEADAGACPVFYGRLISGVKNGPSPEWMQKRLKAIGLRPISALVDITNYVSYDLCRPLHVFDADRLNGNLTVRLSKQGENMTGLDERDYVLNDEMTVIADDKGVVALGGIMGSEETGCTDETTSVFLEVAYFEPIRTARTGRTLQINSDARYRFERGVDPDFLAKATDLATKMILDLCGGQASDIVKAGQEPDRAKTIEFSPSYVKNLIGIEISEDEQIKILSDLGFSSTKKSDDHYEVAVPSWRPDIEGRADLVEEVTRIYGYDKIETVSLPALHSVTVARETTQQSYIRLARQSLATRGMQEAVTWSFMDDKLAAEFGSNDNQAAESLRVVNPISTELSQMRPSILPNLIEAAQKNHDRGFSNAALFEIGPVYKSAQADGHLMTAAGIRFASAGVRHWADPQAHRTVDLYDAKADALAVLRGCGAPADSAQVTRDAPDYYHPGRSAVLRLGPNVLAQFGEIHPAIMDSMGISQAVVGFEVFLNNVPAPKKKGKQIPLLQLSAFQPVQRDFAFVVDQDVEAMDLVKAVKTADKKLIQDVSVFDVYSGDKMETGKKSVAINIVIQPEQRTLTDQELEDISQKVINTVTQKTGGVLR